MTVTTSRGRSHAKLILVGEHAVVYGTPAIAIPLPEIGVVVTAVASDRVAAAATPTRVELISTLYRGDLAQAPAELQNLQVLLASFWAQWPADLARPQRLQLTIDSQIPFERGMGSSAAIATACTEALQGLLPQPLAPAAFMTIITREEQAQHGNPSGLDALVVAAAQGYFFRKNEQPQPLRLRLPGYLLIVDSGQTGRTGAAIQAVAQLRAQAPTMWREQMTAIGQLVPQVQTLLTTASSSSLAEQQEQFGQLLNRNQQALAALGVSTPTITQIIDQLMSAGALGAKLTGGGLGGCVFGYFADRAQAQAAQQQFRQQTWLTALNADHGKDHPHD